MTAQHDPRSSSRGLRFVIAYLVVLVAVWAFSVATWTVVDDATPQLHPIAQGAQFLLIVVAGTLVALYLRGQARDLGSATLGFYERRWEIRDDTGGRTLWPAVFVGAAAMLLNVAILIVADLLVGSGASAGSYIEWIAAGIGAGLLLGSFGALAAAGVAAVGRLARR